MKKLTGAAYLIQDAIYMENLRRVLPVLRQHRINTVTVNFDGGGDDGAIENVFYEPCGNPDALKTLPVEHLSTSSYFEDGQWRRAITPEQSTLDEVIEGLTNDYLEETGVDWYNDDGGFGELVIDVPHGTVSLNVQIRYTHTTTEYSAERDIETGDDI